MTNKIVLLNHHGFGNVVLSLPVLHSLNEWVRSKETKAVVLLNSPLHRALLLDQDLDALDYVFLSDRSNPLNWMKVVGKIWRPDLLMAVPNVPASTIEKMKKLIRPKKVIAEGIPPIELNLGTHVIDVQNELLKLADLPSIQSKPALNHALRSKKEVERIGLHPFTDSGKESKQWPLAQFMELLAAIDPREILLFGGPEERDQMEILKQHYQDLSITLPNGFQMDHTLERMESCDLFISGDTGPAHMAAALRVPVFAIFGPTGPNRIGPIYTQHRICTPQTDCHPCFVDTWTDCDCIHTIDSKRALEELQSFIAEIESIL